eukprot:8364399-Pyramimonas_sp.AAC.1
MQMHYTTIQCNLFQRDAELHTALPYGAPYHTAMRYTTLPMHIEGATLSYAMLRPTTPNTPNLTLHRTPLLCIPL